MLSRPGGLCSKGTGKLGNSKYPEVWTLTVSLERRNSLGWDQMADPEVILGQESHRTEWRYAEGLGVSL